MNRIDAAKNVQVRPGLTGGMACLDTSGNPRIPMLMELVGALSRANEPGEVLRVFSDGVKRLYGPRGYISISTRDLAPGQYRITRFVRDADPDAIARVDAWSTSAEIPVHRGGFIGELIRSAYPEIIHHLSVPDDPVLGDGLSAYGSLMAIPLFDDGEPKNWSINLREHPEGFTVEDLEHWVLPANLVGGTVKNTVISRQLRAAGAEIQQEMDRIADIQRALLPARMPEITGARLAASYETFDRAGGDYYDFLPLRHRPDGSPDPDAPWCLLIADASGHGPAAAVVMAMLQALLHAYPHMPEGPSEILEHANNHLHAKRIESSFVTALLAIYDPATRELRYARAGHHPPILKGPGAGGAVHRLDEVGGIPLGIAADVRYEVATRRLEPGQSVVLYTDGITEAVNGDGHMFAVAGIERSLQACSGEPDCVVPSITTAVRREHEGTVRPRDDQTIVVMRVE